MENKGWHSRGYLPHFDAGGVVQHVVLNTKAALLSSFYDSLSDLDFAEKFEKVEAALDASASGNVFKNADCAAALERELIFFEGDHYDLLAWCIMPNHVHVVLCCLGNTSLGQIVRSWKVQSTIAINRLLCRKGSVFAKDYFDRFMRDGGQTERAIAYVENNPVAAGLCRHPSDWRYSSAWHRSRGWEPCKTNLPLTIR
jgi:putative transposase